MKSIKTLYHLNLALEVIHRSALELLCASERDGVCVKEIERERERDREREGERGSERERVWR